MSVLRVALWQRCRSVPASSDYCPCLRLCPSLPRPHPQLVSGFSRMLAAVLAAVPPYRSNGDEAVVNRLIRRPNSAMEAAARAPAELVLGFAGAAGGLLMDPISVR